MSIDSIDENFLPSLCSTGSGNTYCELTKLSDFSTEYTKCRNTMFGNFVKNFIAVYRVENKFLERQYQLKLITKRSDFPNLSERELLHCTAKHNVSSIIENNFDPHRATRVKFGRGVSFSPDAEYANLQSSAGDGIRAMFICKVMIGKTQGGSEHGAPQPGYDTMVDRRGNVFVKYNDNEFYPTHVMFYRSYPVVSYRGQRSIQRS